MGKKSRTFHTQGPLCGINFDNKMDKLKFNNVVSNFREEINNKRLETPYTVNEIRVLCKNSLNIITKFLSDNPEYQETFSEPISLIKESIDKADNYYLNYDRELEKSSVDWMDVVRLSQGAFELLKSKLN